MKFANSPAKLLFFTCVMTAVFAVDVQKCRHVSADKSSFEITDVAKTFGQLFELFHGDELTDDGDEACVYVSSDPPGLPCNVNKIIL